MTLKMYEGLTDYLLSATGAVISAKTFQQIEPSQGGTYKLVTDEVVVLSNKKKSPRLVRRFTLEEVKKMFANPKAKVVDVDQPISTLVEEVKENGDKTTVMEIKSESFPMAKTKGKGKKTDFEKAINEAAEALLKEGNPKMVANLLSTAKPVIPDGFKLPYFIYNGQPYQSARKAAVAAGVSVNTAISKAKAGKDGFKYIDQ